MKKKNFNGPGSHKTALSILKPAITWNTKQLALFTCNIED